MRGTRGENDDDRPQVTGLPLRRVDVGIFFGAYALLTVVWYLLGRSILSFDSVVKIDTDISQWFARHRTPRLNYLTSIGSALSATTVKVAVTLVITLVMYFVWHSWLEPAVVVLPLVLEAMVFITVTWMVGRPRPDVPRLEMSPVDSSFPSGHAAAAMVYSAFGIVVFWHTRRLWIRIMVSVAAISVALIVGLSRLYRGMHHLTDVVAGFALGAVAIAVAWWIVTTAWERSPRSTEPAPMADLAATR
jgi:membrane-associated phospholipid phosphatase